VPPTAVIRKDRQAVITVVDEAVTAMLGRSADGLVSYRGDRLGAIVEAQLGD
jgi:hypothetical protein